VWENFGNSRGDGVDFGGQFWKILRGGGSYGKSLPWGWYGYFLEPHIITVIFYNYYNNNYL